MPQYGTAGFWDCVSQHSILIAGLPLFMEYEADAITYPGMVVEFTATDGHIKPADTKGDNIVGVADIAMATQDGNGSRRKADCDPNVSDADENPYAIGDQVKVINGTIIVMLILEAGNDIVPGDKLQVGNTDGMVTEMSCALASANPCSLIAEALETAFTGAGECEYIAAKLLM
jgi:hypothetical protein